jgi:hypothetical protein
MERKWWPGLPRVLDYEQPSRYAEKKSPLAAGFVSM